MQHDLAGSHSTDQ